MSLLYWQYNALWAGGGWIPLAAYILDRIIGDPRWLPHPVIGMGKAIQAVERMIRSWRLPEHRLRMAGLLLPILIVGGVWVMTWMLLLAAQWIHPYAAAGLEIVLIATTIASKGLKQAGMAVYRDLIGQDRPAARRSLSMVVGRDTADLDEPEIIRGTVETIAENIVDAVISPLIYAMIGGAPLAMAYRAVNTLDSMVGYKNDRYLYLGWASARLDDIANYIPARITAVLLVMLSMPMRLNAAGAWQAVMRDASGHPSPNSGYPEAAVAGALGIRLGGQNSYHGVISHRAYMGTARRSMVPDDIIRTSRLMYWTGTVMAFGGTALLLWIGRGGGGT
ncbi:adenosylcobinamide-phosphate synthase CbiB [Paenibacillus wulumuqiensis]|uniref:adenosylcobinamide-phosphate synthase CbiB n=1 Tax=Paenibacillus wulumuqiensis TaxID=1567107 RepID=UPI000619208A|nr:adenosylcobinamide-phosphate synthase CbiB [Paenibacillus wulumuqiensis]